MNLTEQRKKFRSLIGGSKALSPASVFDPMSALIAQSVGYEIGLLAGSGVSATTLAAPDLCVHTITEYADQVRRIKRVSDICLFVDADGGYGNALNVMRCVQELEHAGVSGLSIEDTLLPRAFGQADGDNRMISIEEGVGKLRAALAARSDPSLVIAARTSALTFGGIDSAIARAKAYAATGVDMFFIAGRVDNLEHVRAVQAACKLPMIIGSQRGSLTPAQLEACGARILNPSHQIISAVAKTMRDTYAHQRQHGAPADLTGKVLTAQEMEALLQGANYNQRLREFMQ
jgi:oxaloacetate decarboxylase